MSPRLRCGDVSTPNGVCAKGSCSALDLTAIPRRGAGLQGVVESSFEPGLAGALELESAGGWLSPTVGYGVGPGSTELVSRIRPWLPALIGAGFFTWTCVRGDAGATGALTVFAGATAVGASVDSGPCGRCSTGTFGATVGPL